MLIPLLDAEVGEAHDRAKCARCSTPPACRTRPCSASTRSSNDPQARALGIIQQGPEGALPTLGLPLRFDGVRPEYERAAPQLGEHGRRPADIVKDYAERHRRLSCHSPRISPLSSPVSVEEGTPAEARAVAKTGFIDCIGTMIAGSREADHGDAPVGARAVAARATCSCGSGDADLAPPKPRSSWASRRTRSTTTTSRCAAIPSAALVPAILAAGQELGSTGAQMLDAYVAGYEVWANLVERETDVHHMKGWHPTGIFGAIGAAAACAALRKLDAKQSSYALGLGASQSAGLMANFGSMAKPFHAGRAAQAGVMAARLAAGGFTAQPDVLEHPQGFLAAVSPQGNVDRERAAATLGQHVAASSPSG